MTRTTQPRYVLQIFFAMPPALDRLGMHKSRYQMVIRERNPVALAELVLADVTTGARGCGRRRGRGLQVSGENRRQERGDI